MQTEASLHAKLAGRLADLRTQFQMQSYGDGPQFCRSIAWPLLLGLRHQDFGGRDPENSLPRNEGLLNLLGLSRPHPNGPSFIVKLIQMMTSAI